MQAAGWALVAVVLLMSAPVATAQQATVEIIDAANDIQYRNPAGTTGPAPQTYEALDIVRAWIGEETLTAFRVGLDRTGATSQSEVPLVENPYRLWVEWGFSSMRYRVEFGECGPNAANLQVLAAGATRWSELGCIDASDTGTEVSAAVEKALVSDADGFPVRAASVLSDWSAGSDELVSSTQVHAFDRAPDTGAGDTITMELGDTRFGDLVLSTISAYRSSNGGIETMVFPVRVDNHGTTSTSAFVAGASLPPGWSLRVPPRITIPASSSITFPAIVTTDFGHNHGTTETFQVQVTPSDGQPGQLELGIIFLEIPQLAGHHPDLHLHAGSEQDITGAETGGQGWFNTMADDPNDTGNDLVANGGGQSGGTSNAEWAMPLDPSLLIGMDFDTSLTGLFATEITTQVPANDANLLTGLWHCKPGDGTGSSFGVPCPSGTWFLLAQGQSAPQAVQAGGSSPFETVLTPEPYSDLVPYLKGSNIALRAELTWSGPPAAGALTPALRSGSSMMRLPLNEYRDPIDESFQTIGDLQLTPLDAYEQPANPGQAAWYEFTLVNAGQSSRTITLDAAGHGKAWIDWLPADDFTLEAGEARQIAFRVTVPADALPGEYAEAFVVAQDADDPLVLALSPIRTYVIETPVQEAPQPDIEPGDRQAPGLGIAILAVGLLLAARRRIP